MNQTNGLQLVDLINQNSDERQELISEFVNNRLGFGELYDELNRLERELEVMNYNWLADNEIVMHPWDLEPDELLHPNMN